jgi:hypothetical protein
MTPTDARRRRASPRTAAIAFCLAVFAGALSGATPARAQGAAYPEIAPMAQYRMASQDEIALARSAAPPSISGGAEVLTLGALGYETAVKGSNGFVCIVERAWANEFDNAEFWNPKVRGPICFNPAAARSVLSTYLERTKWVLAGVSRTEMLERTKAAIASGRIGPPEPGAMCYMMSKDGYLGDGAGGHWHSHLMFFLPRGAVGAPPEWGADHPGSPVLFAGPGLDPAATYFVLVAKWSDGTSAVMGM